MNYTDRTLTEPQLAFFRSSSYETNVFECCPTVLQVLVDSRECAVSSECIPKKLTMFDY